MTTPFWKNVHELAKLRRKSPGTESAQCAESAKIITLEWEVREANGHAAELQRQLTSFRSTCRKLADMLVEAEDRRDTAEAKVKELNDILYY